MHASEGGLPELPNLVSILERACAGTPLAHFLALFVNVIFSLIIIVVILLITWAATRRMTLIPTGIQNVAELFVGTLDGFVCGILGPKGRQYTPFIGTLFIYILFMNAFSFIPFLKAPTTSWSTTLALALCVFAYVQYTAFKTLGFRGYLFELAGKPRGIIAFSVFIPVMMFFIHIVSELIKPISLSLRLRSNIWGDDLLLTILAGFGLTGLPLLLLNTFLAIIAGLVQTLVFCLLTTIYFALILVEQEEH